MSDNWHRPVQADSHFAFESLWKRQRPALAVRVPRRLIPLVSCVVVLVLAGARLSFGQSGDERSFQRIRDVTARYERNVGLVTVRFDGIGNPHVELVPGFEFATAASVALRLLFSEDGQEALDCIRDQEASLQELRTRLARRLRSLSSFEADDEKEAMRRYETAYAAAWRDARRVLLPNQERRLDQLVTRYFIRQYGWAHALCNRPLRETLEVTAVQRSRLAALARRLYVDIEAEAVKVEQRAIRDILNTLPVEKRRQVETALGSPLPSNKPAIDLLIWHLERFSQIPTDDQEADTSATPHAPVADLSRRGLTLPITAPDRGAIVMSLAAVARRSVHIVPTQTAPMTSDLLTRLLLSPAVQEELELSENQKKSIQERYLEAFTLIRTNFGPFSREFGGDIAIKMIAEQQEPIRRAMFATLLPHQKERLSRIVTFRHVRLNGLPQVIVEGAVRKLRPLTLQEVDVMRNAAAKTAAVLRQKRIEWEEQIRRELHAVLDSDQRKQLARLVGRPLAADVSWVSLTLAQLHDGVRDEAGLYDAWQKRAYR